MGLRVTRADVNADPDILDFGQLEPNDRQIPIWQDDGSRWNLVDQFEIAGLYDTLSDMMALSGSDFVAGDIITTRGHTSVNDGCGGRFIVVSSLPKLSDGTTDLPVDNTGCVNALTGSKWAIHADYYLRKIIYPKMFGAAGNAATGQDTQLDNMWDCYADLAQLNAGTTYSFVFGSRLPEMPEIVIPPGIYGRTTYAVRELNFDGLTLTASPDAVLVRQGFRFKGDYGTVTGLRLQGNNTANSYGIHQGDANFDTNDGTQLWTFRDCFVEKFAVNWLVTADVESTYINCQANQATTINRAILRATDGHWKGYRGRRSAGKWGTLIQPWGTGSSGIVIGGMHFEDDSERTAEGRNAFITGGDGSSSLTTSDDPYLWVPSGYSSVKVGAAWESYFHDCDWANDSEDSQNPTRRNLTVTAMAQSPANSSWTRVTVSTPHFLQHIMDIGHDYYEFTSCGDFSAAAGSGSALTIMNVISTTVFDCDINPSGKASFSGTGNLALPEYNLAIYGQSTGWAAGNLNSMKFIGGHANWTLWGRSRNVQWLGFRHKQDLVTDGPALILGGIVEECFTGDMAGVATFDNNLRIVGPGAIDIARHGSRDFNLVDNVTRVSNDYGHAIERALVSGGIAADGGAAKMVRFANKYDRGEFGIVTALTGALTGAYFNETALNFVTADVSGFPIVGAQTKATGSSTNRLLETRANDPGLNIYDQGAVGNDGGATDAASAVTAQVARLVGNTFGSQYAANGENALCYPAGNFSSSAGSTITTTGTGQAIIGIASALSRLDKIDIVLDDRHTTLRSLSLTGATSTGLKLSNTSRRYGFISDVHIRDKTSYGVLLEGGAIDLFSNVLIEKNKHGVVQTGVPGDYSSGYFNNAVIHTSTVNGIRGVTGEARFNNTIIQNSGSHGVFLYGRPSGNSTVENYFQGLSSTGQQTASFKTITAVASAGGGNITFTCTNDFETNDKVEVYGTGDVNYDTTHTIVSATSSSFTVTATFGSTATGVVRREGEPVWRILSVADYSGTIAGTVKITTDGAHTFAPGQINAIITGTTDYDNTNATIVDVTATNEIIVSATFTSTKTGTLARRGWDLYIDALWSGGSLVDVNDQYFTGGNLNWTRVRGYNIQFMGTRLKQGLWFDEVERVGIWGSLRARNSDVYSDVIPTGPGSYRGWAACALRDDATATDGDCYMAIMAPHAATGVGSNNKPKINEWAAKTTGVYGQVNDVVVVSVTDVLAATTLPLQVNSGTATPAGGTAGTGVAFGSAGPCIIWGSGAPSASAAKGSLYLRTDGSTTNDRMYVNMNGTTTWTAVITAA